MQRYEKKSKVIILNSLFHTSTAVAVIVNLVFRHIDVEADGGPVYQHPVNLVFQCLMAEGNIQCTTGEDRASIVNIPLQGAVEIATDITQAEVQDTLARDGEIPVGPAGDRLLPQAPRPRAYPGGPGRRPTRRGFSAADDGAAGRVRRARGT